VDTSEKVVLVASWGRRWSDPTAQRPQLIPPGLFSCRQGLRGALLKGSHPRAATLSGALFFHREECPFVLPGLRQHTKKTHQGFELLLSGARHPTSSSHGLQERVRFSKTRSPLLLRQLLINAEKVSSFVTSHR